MNFFFCGDIMPGGVLPYQDIYITSDLKEYIASFDFRIGTLEAAIGTGLSFDPVKMNGRANIVYARNEDFYRIKEMGFDVVSLANNHVWDLGKEGLKNTISILKENNIQYCGAGMNIDEASKPTVVEKEGKRIAILAYCMYGNKYLGYVELAGENKAGINPLDIGKVVSDIKSAKQKYDIVIVLPHWGREYHFDPLPECVTMAKQMVEAGADAVFGSHTHQIQPIVKYKGKPVCFSMGNFLFPDFYMYPPRPIWYPDSVEDVKEVEDVVGYPFPIEKPIRQVWNSISRYGCTIGFSIQNGETKTAAQYVHLSNQNILSLSSLPRSMKLQLRKYGLIESNRIVKMIVCAKRKVLAKITR